ncbi:MAG TPA: sigma 54-interacting transcriptional regulator [Candidatus Sulfotelmatobacter sp.]|nr:sigma 54-interacting transcriptional regulator [Candidatus Sulfotelmatobacter sp.]
MPTSYRSSDKPEAVRSAANNSTDPQSQGASPPSSGVFSMDREGRIRSCNDAFSQFLGYSFQQLTGRDFTEIFRGQEAGGGGPLPKLRKAVAEAAAQGEYRELLIASHRDGTKITVRFSATLLRDSGAGTETIVVLAKRSEEEASLPAAESSAAVKGRNIIARTIDGIQFILASPVMHEFMALVDRVASHTETVLVTGETGTGKELIARTIHESSHRRNRPWVDINCAALPENLVESELFGYEKGAFSGADASKPGLFELADKGTLFLDEIGELQLHTQVKLLRILDNQPFYRLGGHRKIRVDVRVVAATNQDLEAAVRNGGFRQDLYHRLGQFQLRVPPLRERPEDIVALAEHFLRLKSPKKHYSPQAISALLSHSWPGNIRELRNLVAKVAMESSGSEIDFSKLSAALTGEPAAIRQTASMPIGNLDSMEEQMIIKALERTGGHRTLAAEQLGISRRTLSRKLREYNINFAAGDAPAPLNFVSTEQQKFFRARVEIPVTIKNSRGDETHVQGVNLSTGGMGLDGVNEPLRFAGLLDIKFDLPETDIHFQAKARLMWVGDDGRVGIRFAVIEPALFEQLQRWTNRKMKDEGWEFSG